MMQITTAFSKSAVKTVKLIVTAAELDGPEMTDALEQAGVAAQAAKNQAYEHSSMEKVIAEHLSALVDVLKIVVR